MGAAHIDETRGDAFRGLAALTLLEYEGALKSLFACDGTVGMSQLPQRLPALIETLTDVRLPRFSDLRATVSRFNLSRRQTVHPQPCFYRDQIESLVQRTINELSAGEVASVDVPLMEAGVGLLSPRRSSRRGRGCSRRRATHRRSFSSSRRRVQSRRTCSSMRV